MKKTTVYKEKPNIIGIDPGFSGAIAVINPLKEKGERLVALYDIPIQIRLKKKYVDVHAVASIVDIHSKYAGLSVIEEPGAYPQQGLSSTFRFGFSCGQLHGVLAANYLPTVAVKPQVWKPHLGLSRDKKPSLDLAIKEFPETEKFLQRKKDHDRAEAILLAYYGMKNCLQIFDPRN